MVHIINIKCKFIVNFFKIIAIISFVLLIGPSVLIAGAPYYCIYSIQPTSSTFTDSSNTGTVAVTTSYPICSWSATSNASWITITAGGTGTGNGTVSYSVSANTTGNNRSGTITIAGQTFTVTQDGTYTPCTYTINPASALFTYLSSDAGTVVVTTSSPTCYWSATSSASWITITAGGTGTGNGTVSYSVSDNTTGNDRSGTITIGGQTFNVTQRSSSCTYIIDPTSSLFNSLGNTGMVAVTTSFPTCPWDATSNASWITTAGNGGLGSGTVSYSVSANTTGSNRNGTITIGGQTFNVTQNGPTYCTYIIEPTSSTFSSALGNGNTGTVAVTTSFPSCSWSAASNAVWIAITGGSAGTGNGTVSYSISFNGTGSNRTGNITIAEQTFTVTQYAATPTDGGGSGGCFIATAAFGSPMERHVQILRDFRDRYVLDYKVGQKFVKLYYQTSPPIAEMIAKNESLRFLTRWFLSPIIGIAYLTVNFGIVAMTLIVGFILLILVSSLWLVKRTRLRISEIDDN